MRNRIKTMKRPSCPITPLGCSLIALLAVAPRWCIAAEATIPWPSRPPADCPLEKSQALSGIAFTGRHKEYAGANTWYPTWASDGDLYSPWTDGQVGRMRCYSGPQAWNTGNAKISGDDPLNLKVVALGKHKASAEPYGGRYPCGSLLHDGTWYYGTYCLDQKKDPWDTMGPLVGFRLSKDFGKTWTDTPCTPAKPLFGESGKNGAKVKIGTPHFVELRQEHGTLARRQGLSHGPRGNPARGHVQLDLRRPGLPGPGQAEPGEHQRRDEVRILRRPRCPRRAAVDGRFFPDPAAGGVAGPRGLRNHDVQRAAAALPDVRDRRRSDRQRAVPHLDRRVAANQRALAAGDLPREIRPTRRIS